MRDNYTPLTDSERQDAETMADAILAIPADKRDRVRDVLFGYRAGLTEGIRIATNPTMLCVRPTA